MLPKLLLLALASALLLPASAGAQDCVSRPAVGGGTITSCRPPAGSAAPPAQWRERPAVGGGSIASGGGRSCYSRPAVGGGTITTCSGGGQ